MSYFSFINGIWSRLEYTAELATPRQQAGGATLLFLSAAIIASTVAPFPTAFAIGATFTSMIGGTGYWAHRQVEVFKNSLRVPPNHKNRATLTLLRIPNEHRKNLVQQANNLNIPEEQRLDALRLLTTLPYGDGQLEKIVQQANNLNIPEEQRLTKFRLLCELGEQRPEFIRQINRINIINQAQLLEEFILIDTIPNDQKIQFLTQANQLISAEMTDPEKLEILQILTPLTPEQRANICNSLARLPYQNRVEIVQQTKNLHIPIEQRFNTLDLLQLVGVYRDGDLAEIVQQANNLNIPDEQRLYALRVFILFPRGAGERAETVQQANSLNIPNEQRLTKFHLLYDLNERRPEFIRQINRINIINQDNLLEEFTLIDTIPNDQKIQFLAQANQLISAEMTDPEKLEILQILTPLPPEQRELFVVLFKYLPLDRNNRKIEIIRALDLVEDKTPNTIGRLIRLKNVFKINNPNIARMLEIADNVKEGVLEAFIEQGRSFIHPFTSSNEKIQILYHLSRAPEEHRGATKNFTNFTMNTTKKIEILEICSGITEDAFNFVTQQFSILIKLTTQFENRKQLIRNLAELNPDTRAAFMTMTPQQQEVLIQMTREERASFISMDNPTREAYIRMNRRDREVFISLDRQGRSLLNAMSNREREALIRLPQIERKNFIRQTMITRAQDAATREELELIAQYDNRLLDPGFIDNNQLFINTQDLSDHPHRSLLRALWATNHHHAFPRFNYGGPEIDAGGVTRDFVTKLFDALCCEQQKNLPMTRTPDGKYIPRLLDLEALSAEDRNLVDPSEFGKLSKNRQIECYHGIGAIFARALAPLHNAVITTGIHLHESIFAMIHALTEADLNMIPANFDLNVIPAIHKNLLTVFLKTNYLNLFSNDDGTFIGDAALSEEIDGLLVGTISNRLRDEKGFTQQEVSDLLQASNEAIQATIIIAKSTQQNLPFGESWNDIKGANPETLREKIEGKLTKELVLQSLGINGNAAFLNNQQRFVKRWIEEASPEALEKFVWATTGSKTLASGQPLELRIRGDHLPASLPAFHTCSKSIDLPLYATYEIFKQKLELALANLGEDNNFGIA